MRVEPRRASSEPVPDDLSGRLGGAETNLFPDSRGFAGRANDAGFVTAHGSCGKLDRMADPKQSMSTNGAQKDAAAIRIVTRHGP